MRKFFKYSILLINLFFAVMLVCTRLIPTSNPYEYSFLGLLGYFTPILVVINLLFVFFWLISRKFFYTLVPIIAIWISWPIFSVCFAFNGSSRQNLEKNDSSFTVLSYNVRLLDLYRWNEDKDTRKNIIRFFKKQNASVLCLQEFYSNNDSSGINNIKAIQEACSYKYVAECNTHVSKRGKWGTIIFSHLPIVDDENYAIDVQGNNLLQKADILFKKDTISIFNVHMKSNRFNKKEAALVNQDALPDLSDSTLEQSKSIFQKLQDNASNRGLEADIIASVMTQNQRPLILCGDLNDIPSSYIYFKTRGPLQDAFLEKGFGIGKTYRNTIPLLRIDFIFHDPELQLNGFQKLDVPYSDHEPLLANFSILHDSEN